VPSSGGAVRFAAGALVSGAAAAVGLGAGSVVGGTVGLDASTGASWFEPASEATSAACFDPN